MQSTSLPTLVSIIALWLASVDSARAHSGDMANAGSETIDVWVVTGLIAAAALYAAGIARLWRRAGRGAGVPAWRVIAFFTGLAILALALLPPLDTWGAQLFSMHMLQHELLMLVAAPLAVAGAPLGVFLWAFPPAGRKRLAAALTSTPVPLVWGALVQPLTAWTLHAAMLWLWHVPRFFQAGLADDGVHALQHLCFLLSALLFWSALIGARTPLRHGAAVLYLLTTLIHSGMLGALLTFSPRPWYPAYAGRTEAWGISLLEDQQLGGLIMWVPAGVVLMLAGLLFGAKVLWPHSIDRRA